MPKTSAIERNKKRIRLVAKFAAGAWVTALLIPLMILLMSMVKHHYARVEMQTADDTPLDMSDVRPPFVIVPLDHDLVVPREPVVEAPATAADVHAGYDGHDEHADTHDDGGSTAIDPLIRMAERNGQ